MVPALDIDNNNGKIQLAGRPHSLSYYRLFENQEYEYINIGFVGGIHLAVGPHRLYYYTLFEN